LRTPEEDSELRNVTLRTIAASGEFNEFLIYIHDSFGEDKAKLVADATGIMSTLWDLDKETAVIYTLSTKGSFYTILITRYAQLKFTLPISTEP
jgi:hypothetical protein